MIHNFYVSGVIRKLRTTLVCPSGVRFHARATVFSLLQNVQTDSGPPSMLFSGYLGSVPGAKRQERDVDNSPQPTSSTFRAWEGQLKKESRWRIKWISVTESVAYSKTVSTKLARVGADCALSLCEGEVASLKLFPKIPLHNSTTTLRRYA